MCVFRFIVGVDGILFGRWSRAEADVEVANRSLVKSCAAGTLFSRVEYLCPCNPG